MARLRRPDWSGRHVRLRFEMLLCAAVFFLLATGNAKLNENSIWPIKLTHPDASAIVLAILAAIYLYLLFAFWLRTDLEKGPVTKFDKESVESVAKLKSLLGEFHGKVANFDAEHIMTRLDNWPQFWPKELLLQKKLSELSANLESDISKLRKDIQHVFEKLANGSPDEQKLSRNPRIVLDRLINDTDQQMDKIYAALKKVDESNEVMREADKVTKRNFAEMKVFFESGVFERVAELNIASRENLRTLKSLQRAFYIGSTAFSWERFGVSVFIPVTASLAMMAYGAWSRLPEWWQWLLSPVAL